MDLRREAEALESRQQDDELDESDDEELDEGEEGDEEPEGESDADIDFDGDEGDDDDQPRRKKKKSGKKAAEKKPAAKRSRVAKEVRTRAVWVIFDNGSKVVEKFPFNQKAEAEALLEKKLEEKKGTFYINLVKEEIKD